jgi:EmrB/QacA subfamily drug resistance transporter
MPKSNAEPVAPRWRQHPLLPAFWLSMAGFLTQLDVTAVVVAMPSIGSALGFGIAGYAWVMDAYSLAFTAALLAAGALADRHGRRRALLAGNALFALASLGCGLAWNGPALWAARAVQGIGAAFVVTGAIALAAQVYCEPGSRARAFGFMGVISGVAMALGPTLGGALAAAFGWRWIFLLNVPICLVVAWGVPRLITEVRASEARSDRRPLDLAGVLLATFALGVAIETLLRPGRTWMSIAAGLVLSAVLFALFAAQQRRRAQPMLDPRVFARPAVAAIAALLFAVSVGYWAVLVYLPLFLRAAFGWPAEIAGVALLAATAPMLLLPIAGGRLAARWGWRRLFTTGLAILAAGDLVLVLALASAEPMAGVLFGMVVIGSGAALVHPQLSGAVVALVPSHMAGMASAVTIVMRQAGFAIGIALLGAVLRSDAVATDYASVFGVALVASLGGLAVASLLLPAADATLTKS